MSTNSETVRNTRNVSMNHDYKTGVALTDSVNKTCVKRSLAEKSRWRHIRVATKPRYLGNLASKVTNCYRTLSGSHGRFFRISQEKSPEAPLSGEITMTSYPACNKTSLSRKPCIPDKKLICNTISKSWSLFQNPSWKIAWSAPLAEKSRWCEIRLSMKPRYLGNHVSHMKSYYGTLWGGHGRCFRNRHEKSPKAPPSGEMTMTSYPVDNETSLSRKPCIPDEKLLRNAIRK